MANTQKTRIKTTRPQIPLSTQKHRKAVVSNTPQSESVQQAPNDYRDDGSDE